MLARRIILLLFALPASSTCQDSWKATEEAAARAGKAAHFDEAEKLLSANWRLADTLPAKDPRRPRTAFDLAEIYRAEGKYSQALPVYERALEIYTKLYGDEATEVADTLNGEAELYKSLNDYAHAEPLLLRALSIRQKLLHPGDPDIAQAENDLGEIYTATGAFDKAEPLLTEALASREKHPGGESTDVAQSLESLGNLYSRTGRAQQAEDSFRQAVGIFGKTVGGDHPDYANALENLALCYGARRDFSDAEPLLQRVLEIRQSAFGPEHRDVAASLDNLAALKRSEHKPEESGRHAVRSVTETALRLLTLSAFSGERDQGSIDFRKREEKFGEGPPHRLRGCPPPPADCSSRRSTRPVGRTPIFALAEGRCTIAN